MCRCVQTFDWYCKYMTASALNFQLCFHVPVDGDTTQDNPQRQYQLISTQLKSQSQIIVSYAFFIENYSEK